MARRERDKLPVIGWREWVSLPDLGVDRIKAKVDTGARSSALHAFDIETFRRAGRRMVRFTVHPIQRSERETVIVEAELVGRRRVRNPGGRQEMRPVIRTSVGLMGEVWGIDLTLTNRDAMGFRMLLGRQAVRHRFVIDPGRSYFAGRLRRKKKKKKRKRKKK